MRWPTLVGWETMEPLLVFLFGVAVGLAMMYVLCDLGLAAQDRVELHRLLRWRSPRCRGRNRHDREPRRPAATKSEPCSALMIRPRWASEG